MTFPARGFPESEFRERTARAQSLMGQHGLSALLLTTEADIRYFTGFLTRFWESPTRPWFVVVPASGDPIAVIPSIGAHLMGQSWLSDIRTWQAPDYRDDGVTLLADTLAQVVPAKDRIGVPSGLETHVRMPLQSWSTLQSMLQDRSWTSDLGILRDLRMVKSELEIAKIETACAIGQRVFDKVPTLATKGVALDVVFRKFQMACLDQGADWVSYLAGAADQGGYGDVISPASSRALKDGDVLMLDTGLVWDGYFCDFDRNYSVGAAKPHVSAAYQRLLDATDSAFEIARPGATISDLFHAMNAQVSNGDGAGSVGRFGHGLGMQLTENPSIVPDDKTVLKPGMVLTLEPSCTLDHGKTLVHEENIVVTETGARYLSQPAPRTLPEI